MYERMADALEPEMRRATDALLDAVEAGSGTRLLDLGCGPGYTTEAARERGADALGLDYTPSMVKTAQRKFPNARFVVGDMLHPPTGPWDAIVSRLGVHHADPTWIDAAWRVLAPGGRVAIAELAPRDAEMEKNGMRPASHWVKLFEGAGLQDVTVTTLTLQLGALAERDPLLQAMRAKGHGSQYGDGRIHVVAGRKDLSTQWESRS